MADVSVGRVIMSSGDYLRAFLESNREHGLKRRYESFRPDRIDHSCAYRSITGSLAAPKRLLTCPARNFLRARLGPTQPGKPVRLDLHTLVGKGNNLRLSKMHVLVEPINLPEAEEWVEMVMEAAYIGA